MLLQLLLKSAVSPLTNPYHNCWGQSFLLPNDIGCGKKPSEDTLAQKSSSLSDVIKLNTFDPERIKREPQYVDL